MNLVQVVGSVGFIISGFLFMIETQPSWLGIQPFKLGWHVGFWNLIGGIIFLSLCTLPRSPHVEENRMTYFTEVGRTVCPKEELNAARVKSFGFLGEVSQKTCQDFSHCGPPPRDGGRG